MSIIARRIPHGLGYLPSTTVRARTVRGGLGAEEALGWFIYPGSTTPPTTPIAPTTVNPNTLPLCSVTPKYQPCRNYIGGTATYSTGPAAGPATGPATTKSTDWGAVVGAMTSFLAPRPAAAPASSVMPYAPAAGGMSKGAMIAIGLGAAGLLAIVMLTRK